MVGIPDARSWSPESLELVRRLVVQAVFGLGVTRKDAAAMYGVSENTIGEWCAAFKQFGEESFSVETSGRRMGSGCTYAPRGETPVLEFPKTRIAQNMITSVTPTGDLKWWVYSGTMTAERFIEWLGMLLEDAPKKIFLFIDSHPAHTSKAVEQWVCERQDRIELIWLPRYSPEHNPDEFLNNDVKQNLKNAPLPNDTPAFHDTLTNILSEIAQYPNRSKGYFQQSPIAPRFQ